MGGKQAGAHSIQFGDVEECAGSLNLERPGLREACELS